MPSLGATLGFALAALILIVIPGPSVLFSVGRALAMGRRAGVVSVAGNTVGGAVLVSLVAVGVGAIVTASDTAFTVIKGIGALYLIYLGVQTVRHRRARAADVLQGGTQPLGRVFVQASVVGFTNPKSLAFFVAVLPQFVDHDHGSAGVQMLVFGAIFCVIAFCSDSCWALAAGHARDWFARSPRRIEGMSTVGGVMMVALGGVLATVRRV